MLITSYHVSRIIFIEWELSEDEDEDDSHFEAIAADGSDDDGEDEEGPTSFPCTMEAGWCMLEWI